MSPIHVGTGGWFGFNLPRYRGLKGYSRFFDFVEVNVTFYKYPDRRLVQTWRKAVPDSFIFAVKGHRDITHRYKLAPKEPVINSLTRNIETCSVLRAEFLVLETPREVRITDEVIENFGNLLSVVGNGVRIVWEPRARPLPRKALRFMEEYDIVHCIDLSREKPSVRADVSYSRLFGKGEYNQYQFTDEELLQIFDKSSKQGSKKTVLSFHGVKMYQDAARTRGYLKTGKFPPATRTVGLESLREVLDEDAQFPSTSSKLIQHQGWKVIDITPSERVHASQVLDLLDGKKVYRSTDEVVSELKFKIAQ